MFLPSGLKMYFSMPYGVLTMFLPTGLKMNFSTPYRMRMTMIKKGSDNVLTYRSKDELLHAIPNENNDDG